MKYYRVESKAMPVLWGEVTLMCARAHAYVFGMRIHM